MDFSGCLRCFCSDFDGPCTGLILSCCKEAHEAEQTVACCDQFFQAGLGKTKILEEHFFLILFEFGDFCLDLGADDEYFAVVLFCIFADGLYIGVVCTVVSEIILCYVCCVDDRFTGQQVVLCDPFLLVLVLQLHQDGIFSVLEQFFQTLLEFELFCCLFVHSCRFCSFGNTALEYLKVGEDQLKVDGLDITERINAAVYVDNVRILEASDNVNDSVYLTDIGKELVSKSLSFGCTFYKTCDVNELDDSRCYFLGLIEISELLQTLVRNRHDADIRVNGTERIVCALCSCFGQGIEKCTFSDVRKAHDT